MHLRRYIMPNDTWNRTALIFSSRVMLTSTCYSKENSMLFFIFSVIFIFCRLVKIDNNGPVFGPKRRNEPAWCCPQLYCMNFENNTEFSLLYQHHIHGSKKGGPIPRIDLYYKTFGILGWWLQFVDRGLSLSALCPKTKGDTITNLSTFCTTVQTNRNWMRWDFQF